MCLLLLLSNHVHVPFDVPTNARVHAYLLRFPLISMFVVFHVNAPFCFTLKFPFNVCVNAPCHDSLKVPLNVPLNAHSVPLNVSC